MTTSMQELRQELGKLGAYAARRFKQVIAEATSEILQLQTDLTHCVTASLRIGGVR